MVFTILEGGSSNGEIYAASSTFFPIIGGRSFLYTVEADADHHVYDTLTWANLLIRVTVNDAASATVIRTRVNGANGNALISVAAGLLGEFEDTVNSEALTDGDLINYSLVRLGGGVNWRLSYFSTTFEHPSDSVNLLVGRDVVMTGGISATRFSALINESQEFPVEALSPITFNFAGTMDRFRLFVISNGLDTALTCRSRVNTANGNLLITVAAGLTGEFEDVVNSDAIVSGDDVNLTWIETASVGAATFGHQVRFIPSATNAYLRSHCGPDSNTPGVTRFTMLEGTGFPSAEFTSQMSVRATSITVNNLFINVSANTLTTAAATIVNRINGADGSLLITVAAGLTGYFEDIAGPDTIGIGDNSNYSMRVAAGGAGLITFSTLGVQLAEIPAAFDTARKYPNPDSIEVADRFASSGIKYPVPISLVVAQRFRNSARKYPRPQS